MTISLSCKIVSYKLRVIDNDLLGSLENVELNLQAQLSFCNSQFEYFYRTELDAVRQAVL